MRCYYIAIILAPHTTYHKIDFLLSFFLYGCILILKVLDIALSGDVHFCSMMERRWAVSERPNALDG